MSEVSHHNPEVEETESPAVVCDTGFLCGERFTDLSAGVYDLTVSPTTDYKGHQNAPERRYYELYNAINEKFGRKRPVVLVGQSMGADEVLQYTALHSDRVKGVILLAPHGLALTEAHQPLEPVPSGDMARMSRFDRHKRKVSLKDRAKLAKQAAQITWNNASAALEPAYERRINLSGPSRAERMSAAAKKNIGAVVYGLADLKRVWDEIGYATYDNQVAADAMHAIAQINQTRDEKHKIRVDIVVSPLDEFGSTLTPEDAENGLKDKWPALFGVDGKMYDFISVASFNHPQAIHEAVMLSGDMTRQIVTERLP